MTDLPSLVTRHRVQEVKPGTNSDVMTKCYCYSITSRHVVWRDVTKEADGVRPGVMTCGGIAYCLLLLPHRTQMPPQSLNFHAIRGQATLEPQSTGTLSDTWMYVCMYVCMTYVADCTLLDISVCRLFIVMFLHLILISVTISMPLHCTSTWYTGSKYENRTIYILLCCCVFFCVCFLGGI